jgi:hypothetical protein
LIICVAVERVVIAFVVIEYIWRARAAKEVAVWWWRSDRVLRESRWRWGGR